MQHNIEERKVAGVVKECNFALDGKGFTQLEVLVGLAELAGRVVVESCQTSIQMDDMHKIFHDHMARAIRIGAHATGKHFIDNAG